MAGEAPITATFDFVAAADALISAAGNSQQALGKLRDKYEENIAAAKGLVDAQRKLKDGGLKTSETYAALGAKLGELRKATARMGGAYLELGGDFEKAAPGKVAAAEMAKAAQAMDRAREKEAAAAEAAATRATALAEKQGVEAQALAEKRATATGQDTAADAFIASTGRSTGALRKMRAELEENEQALSKLQAAQGKLAQGSKGYDELGGKIGALKDRNATLSQSYVRLGGDFTKASPRRFKLDAESLTKVVGQIPGPLGQIAQKADALSAAMGNSGLARAVGIGAASLAGIALTAGAAAAGLIAFGVAMTASAQKTDLQNRAFGALGKGVAYSKEQSKGFSDVVASIAETSALSASEVGGYAQKLLQEGVKPKDLEASLRATTQIAATQGDSYANEFAKKVATSSKAGGSIVKMVGDINTKLGPLADEAYGGIGAQLLKLKDSFVNGFDNLDLSALTGSIAQVTKSVQGLFGGAKTEGKSLMQSLVDGLARGIDGVNLFAIRLESTWLKTRIALLRGLNNLSDAWEGSPFLRGLSNVVDKVERFSVATGKVLGTGGDHTVEEMRAAYAARHGGGAAGPVLSLPSMGGQSGSASPWGNPNMTPQVRDVPVMVNINGNATAEDARMIGELTGRSVANELRTLELQWGTR